MNENLAHTLRPEFKAHVHTTYARLVELFGNSRKVDEYYANWDAPDYAFNICCEAEVRDVKNETNWHIDAQSQEGIDAALALIGAKHSGPGIHECKCEMCPAEAGCPDCTAGRAAQAAREAAKPKVIERNFAKKPDPLPEMTTSEREAFEGIKDPVQRERFLRECRREEGEKRGKKALKREKAKPEKSEPKARPKPAKDADATQDAIEKLNERFFIVDVGSETVVGEEIAHIDMRTRRSWSTFEFRSFADFKKKLIKLRVLSGDKRIPLADVWLGAVTGKQYERLVYAPPGANGLRKDDLNGWKSYTVEPKEGDWSKTQAFILDVVCNGDKELNEWVLDWCAALFQQPGRHAETALVLVGPEGIGKNVAAETLLGHTFDGRHFRITPHVNQVLGEFNDTLSGCCLLVLDEAELLSKKEAGHARSLITAHSLSINRKGIRVADEDSMLHWIFLTNNETNPTGYMAAEDRRYAVLRLSDKHRNDTPYFEALAAALEQGERAAFLDAMITREITRNLRLAPRTAAKDKVKRASWAPVHYFLVRTLRAMGPEAWNAGRGFETAETANEVKDASWKRHVDGQRWNKVEMARAFGAYLQEQHINDLDPQHTLHEAIRKLFPGEDPKATWNRKVRIGDKTPRNSWTLPAWDGMRAALARTVGVEPEALGLDDEDEKD